MSRGFANVGLVWTREEFRRYLGTIPRPSWVNAVCMHHTWSPSLAIRPAGLNRQHIRNLQDFYQVQLGWSAGPHLFIDDTERCIMGMTPLDLRGVHAVSFNRRAIALEVLGNYDAESPVTGRGLHAWRNAAAAAAELLVWLSLPVDPQTVLFHRDDPRTEKTCPGRLIEKAWVLGLIGEAL